MSGGISVTTAVEALAAVLVKMADDPRNNRDGLLNEIFDDFAARICGEGE